MLAELADLKSLLNLDTTTDDAALTQMLATASETFQTECGQPIEKATKTAWSFTGLNSGQEFTLPFRPVVNLTVLEYHTSKGAYASVNTSLFRLIDYDGYYSIEYDNGYSQGVRYRATFEVGYDEIPQEIQDVVLGRASLDWLDSQLGSGRQGLAQKAISASGNSAELGGTDQFSRSYQERRWTDAIRKYRRLP